MVDGRGGAPEVTDDVGRRDRPAPERLRRARDLRASCSARRTTAARERSRCSTRCRSGCSRRRASSARDIAVAEGQALGNHLNFGGPYLGVIAAPAGRRPADARAGSWARRVDVDGRRGYVLTLQAREQHIRREKATSNICTNQTLMALAATVYLAWLGPAGARSELGRASAPRRPPTRAERLTEVAGVEPLFPATRRSSRSSPSGCRVRPTRFATR